VMTEAGRVERLDCNSSLFARYQSCARVMTVESSRVPSHTCRVSSHCFFQGPSPESSRESAVSNPSLRKLLPKFHESFLESL